MAWRRSAVGACCAALAVIGLLIGPAAAAVTDPPPGVLRGDARSVRLRPVLGEVPAASSSRPSRAERARAAIALEACDPTAMLALRAAPSAATGQDPAERCVVAEVRGSGASAPRQLLGPAAITGSDVERVTTRRLGRGRSALVLHLMGTRAAILDEFVVAHLHGKAAVTLDGETVATIELQPGELTVAPGTGFRATTARGLHAAFDDARSEQLVELLRAATMTAAARRIVASVNASVDDKSQFVDDCPVQETPDSLVFGCYGRGTLRVLRVDRPDLAPMMVVSAAHEMLHGAYERLSRPERGKVDAAIEQAYAAIDDPQLTDLVASYEITEPGERLNELHSILATQETTLPPALERYYGRYFTDRHRIVTAYLSYDSVFRALDQQHTQLEEQLGAFDAQLADALARKDAAIARTESLLAQIDSLREQDRIAESNDLVDPQNAAAAAADTSVDAYNALVDQYNAVVEQYNAVVDSARELYDSVSAVPSAPPAP